LRFLSHRPVSSNIAAPADDISLIFWRSSSGEVGFRLSIEAVPEEGAKEQIVEDTKPALRGPGLDDQVNAE